MPILTDDTLSSQFVLPGIVIFVRSLYSSTSVNPSQTIELHLVSVDLVAAISLAHRAGIYASDAYFLECAVRHAAPQLTLDHGLKRAAKVAGLAVLEV